MTAAAAPNSDDQLRRALEAIRQLKTRLAEREAMSSEPIAIIGLGVRFPGGVTTPSELWELLQSGQDATSEVPLSRWDAAALFDSDPAAVGKIMTRRGGFVHDVEQFDPQHFGIAPTEAPHLDPQHRLLLETAWESLENAAIAPDRLAGSDVGVFVGISSSDYAQRLFNRGVDQIDPYVGSGNAHSVAAGRIAYTLGFQGPALAVDTACSSSLVATHLACQSLRQRECSLALTGGVNLQLSPLISINHSRARMLSPDGRCKAFGDAADGFGRADGCGIVVLKRLADAERDGDRILAVIRGSATNQDGRTSGLTVPNGQAQQAVIRAALAQARLSSADIDYVEAHGTGTALGDPIEAHALGDVFRDRAPDRPLLIGSIKSNFGHGEAAAGIAGLIKVVLALQHETLPAHLHAAPPSSRIDWADLPLQIVNAATPWPHQDGRRRIAGVSSFGFGGTNAHVVVAEAPVRPRGAPDAAEPTGCLPLSARTPTALQQLAAALNSHVGKTNSNWDDVCFTSAIGRAQMPYRAVVLASERSTGLTAVADGALPAVCPPERPRIAFQFSGQGSLIPAAGLELLATVPAFREAFAAAAAMVQEQAGWDVATVLKDENRIAQTQFGQVALFCLSYGLARTWQSWGVEPDVVMGHSVGEYAAACIAGVFSLEAALTLLITRAQKMGALGEHGAMIAVAAAPDGLGDSIAATGAEIGAYNTPRQFVLTGDATAVKTCAQKLAAHGLPTIPLRVRQGYHSRQMEPMMAAFKTVAQTVVFSSPQCDFISSVSGQLAGADLETADYWTQQIRRPVQWFRAVESLQKSEVDVIIEMGPQGLLTALSQQTWSTPGPSWIASLQSKNPGTESAQLRAAAAAAWRHGTNLDWSMVYQGRSLQRLPLPTYPFERQSYWLEEPPRTVATYRLKSTAVKCHDRQTITDGIWHVVGDAQAWIDELTARDETVICHGTNALPLSLQAHLQPSTGPHYILLAPSHPQASQWIGAAKAIALEFPREWGGMIVAPTATALAQIEPALAASRSTPVVRVDGDAVTAYQLQRDELPPTAWSARGEVTYLITGGLGALGLHLVEWLIAAGATSLLLLGRRGPDADAQAKITDWTRRGIEVRHAAVDVTDRAQLSTALAALHLPLGGVFHAAGVPGFEPFRTLTAASWESTVAAKITGARWLDELTADSDLDAFVLFSSIASVWGSQGQAAYAAANQSLDDLAQRRRATGRPALSINWGPWAGGGMATPAATAQLQNIGIGLLDPATALTGLGAALAANRTQTVIAQVNWSLFRSVYDLRGPSHLLGGIPVEATALPLSPAVTAPAVLAERLSGANPEERPAIALRHVKDTVSRVLKLPAGAGPSPHTGFADLGIDSLMAISLRKQLAQDLGIELSATLVFDHPDCERLADHLLEHFTASGAEKSFPVPAAESDDDAEAAAELARKLSRLGI
ncbi:MAG: type I polyketide synthase [bacterium]